MLTANLVRVKFHRDRVIPRYVDPDNEQLLFTAERLIETYRWAAGRSRGELAAELDDVPQDPESQFLQQGLLKLLDDRSQFETVSDCPPETIRDAVFGRAAAARLAGTSDREAILSAAANALGVTPAVVESGLFADLKSEQRLTGFDDLSAVRLLHRYNLALAQGVVLKAVRVAVIVRGETPARLRALVRRIKFHRLIAAVAPTGKNTVSLTLDGPMSLFSATQRYALQLASFLPTVIGCRDFQLTAELRWGPDKKPKSFQLTPKDGLVSESQDRGTFVPAEVSMFAEQFRAKIAGWRLHDVAELLPLGDSMWCPDFRIEHIDSGQFVYLEILGFWRRSSVERHIDRLRAHSSDPFVLAISDSLRLDEGDLAELPAEIVRFRQMPLAAEVVRGAAAILEVGEN